MTPRKEGPRATQARAHTGIGITRPPAPANFARTPHPLDIASLCLQKSAHKISTISKTGPHLIYPILEDFYFPRSDTMSCSCNAGVTKALTPDLPHYAKETCSTCGAFVRWQSKPAPENFSPKRKNKGLLKLFPNIDRCSLCLRSREELPGRTTLEVHHVEEVKDGGTDSPDNLWVVCSRCHMMIHQRRRDFADYLTPHPN